MAKTLIAFDVYGTLIDTDGVKATLAQVLAKSADDHLIAQISQTWRDKQLEYSFRRGLMRDYQSFSLCTEQALAYTRAHFGIELTDAETKTLMTSYATLPAFAEVADALAQVDRSQFRLAAFSNGLAKSVEGLLAHAGLIAYFEAIISVDAVQSFKPNPDVYWHLLSEMQADSAWLISSNPFDVIGAKSAGLKSVWIKRDSHAVFDPWGIAPDFEADSLSGLADKIAARA